MTDKEKNAIRELRKQGLGYGKVAERMGMNKETVKSFCQRNGLNGRASALASDFDPKAEYGLCKNCGKAVQQMPKRKQKKFCCDACRHEWWNEHPYMVEKKAYYDFVCLNCGKEFRAYGNRKRKYCSHACYIVDRFGAVETTGNS